jgi:KipI family sensor histidine kinase inhibitor
MAVTTWLPFGDVGLFAELGTVDAADHWQATLGALRPDIEVRRGWSSLLLIGDPVQLRARVDAIGSTPVVASSTRGIDHIISVVYDGDDLAAVAAASGCSEDDVIRRHAAAEYRVVMLGFTRGFPYLSGLDPVLRLPRRPTPRPRVPAGTVAIAGEHCGIYPSASPGGWHLLGRIDVAVFDPAREPPALFAPGDRVRFTVAT